MPHVVNLSGCCQTETEITPFALLGTYLVPRVITFLETRIALHAG